MKSEPFRDPLPSVLLSPDQTLSRPSPRLLDVCAMLAAIVPTTTHPLLSSRRGNGPALYKHFPGEHYHMLTALCGLLRPSVVWEFGTDNGMGTVALLEGLAPDARLFTVDTDGWHAKGNTWLIQEDFDSGRVTQMICDLKADRLFADHLDNLSEAGLIFVSGCILGKNEDVLSSLLETVPFRHGPIIVFNDIRLMTMVHIWAEIQHPKMDMTSFGHWRGSGLVDWPAPATSQPARTTIARPRAIPPTTVADTETAIRLAQTTHATAAIEPGDRTPHINTDRAIEPRRILLLCNQKPNYIPDLLLHGLRKLLGQAVVDYPRKDALYKGILGQPYLDQVDGLMAGDSEVDRTEILAKTSSGFFDLVLCDIRAIDANRSLLQANRCPLALIDGEDRPARIKPGNYVILRRETDGNDFSVPLPMAIPKEVLDWIDRHAETPKTHAIGFLGSTSGLTVERNAILDELCRICPDALIAGWTVSDGKWQGRDAYYSALQSCKMVLTLPGAGFDTFRYWENAACNAAHIASRMPLLIPNDFRDRHEILRFTDIGELAGLVERLGRGSIDWRALTEQSQRRLRMFHTTERRAATILDRLNAAFLR